MILHLIDGGEVEIFRQNCGHYITQDYRGNPTCDWNIHPIRLIEEKHSGFFAIGPWGCDGHWQGSQYIRTPERFEQLIPIRNVLRITRAGEWERPEILRPEPEELLNEEDVNLPI